MCIRDRHTAALDPKTAEKVLELSKKIVNENNITTLMITHNMEDALKSVSYTNLVFQENKNYD